VATEVVFKYRVWAKFNPVKLCWGKTLFFENSTLNITWYWGWFRHLFMFTKSTYDNKLFAIRRFYITKWERMPDRDASCKAYRLGPLDVEVWKSGKQLFLQSRGFDNRKSP
jgi:hypothetical protein